MFFIVYNINYFTRLITAFRNSMRCVSIFLSSRNPPMLLSAADDDDTLQQLLAKCRINSIDEIISVRIRTISVQVCCHAVIGYIGIILLLLFRILLLSTASSSTTSDEERLSVLDSILLLMTLFHSERENNDHGCEVSYRVIPV